MATDGDPQWPVFRLTWKEDNETKEQISPAGDNQSEDIDWPFCDKLMYSEGDAMTIGDTCCRCGAILI